MALVLNGSTDTITGLQINSANIVDGSIVNADINDLAASKLTGALPAISGANLTGVGGGITVAQQFRQTTATATNASDTYFTSNWEKVDSTGQGAIGSFADPSSGVFTFPSTGFYLVTFTAYFEDSGWNNLGTANIQATTNNGSNWGSNAQVYFGTNYDQTGNNYATGTCSTIVDVTDTSNVKVRFRCYSNKTVSWDGSSTESRTFATFIRLGDT
tara:strand:- start:330 stop:974 length:645 start_codon:yes stop_codon:yes gene_type:complete